MTEIEDLRRAHEALAAVRTALKNVSALVGERVPPPRGTYKFIGNDLENWMWRIEQHLLLSEPQE